MELGESFNGGGRGSGKCGSVGACYCSAQLPYPDKVANFEGPTAEGSRGGGGSVTSWGVSGCSWARIGLKVTSKEGRSNSQKRPWRKARTLVSKASPAMSRGAPTRRPPNGFLEEEGLTGGFGGGVLVWRVWIEVRRRSRGRRWRIDSHLHLATPSLRTTSSMVRVIAWEIRFFCLGGSALAVGKGLRWRWSSLTPRECYGVRF